MNNRGCKFDMPHPISSNSRDRDLYTTSRTSNIFVLDTDINRCAEYHCDRHVNKMILESVQIMCTVLNLRGLETPYKSTHRQHPCVLWADQSYDNFLWLGELAAALNKEYRFRYNKDRDHASIRVLADILHFRYESLGLTEFAQAMPACYKAPGNAVAAYRDYYLGEKQSFAFWTRRTPPDWWLSHAA
jgi:hypothetical protein